jgi:hypothetical protein
VSPRPAAARSTHAGVRFILGGQVAELPPGAVRLASGERVPVDFAVVGIGVVPDTGWLAGMVKWTPTGVVCILGPRGCAERCASAGKSRDAACVGRLLALGAAADVPQLRDPSNRLRACLLS